MPMLKSPPNPPLYRIERNSDRSYVMILYNLKISWRNAERETNMYLIRTRYDNTSYHEATNLREALKIAKRREGAIVYKCKDYYYGDNWQGWLPIGVEAEYLASGERVG
jgi:hypothetical protein